MMLLRVLMGLGLGGGLGGLLGYFGQCSSGACPLTANPWRGAALGALLGLGIALSFGPARGGSESAVAEKVAELGGEADFRTRVEKARGLVLVKFHAAWCGWCRKLAPVIDKLAGEFRGRVSFVAVDTDRHGELARRFGVEGLPTMVLFKDGSAAETIVGYREEAALKKILEKHIGQRAG